MKLFSSIRERLVLLEHFKESNAEKLAATDIATLLKCVDLLQECMQGFGGRDGYDKVNETLAAVRELSEQREK